MRFGIRFDPFRHPNPQGVSRREIGVPENSFVLGSVGRSNPDKNPEFLLKVLEEAIRLDPSSHLVGVGEGVLRQRLLELVKEGGYVDRVHFLGVRDDIPALLRNVFDVFVLASP
jgi:glycosyltransferase involved in cell wall biosynthesis